MTSSRRPRIPFSPLLLGIALVACSPAPSPGSPASTSGAAPGYDSGSPSPPAAPPPSAPAPAAAPGGATPYRVVDGYKVDADTMQGFRTWRAAACDRCHGANQEGLVGPSLVASLKLLSEADFRKTVLEGRLDKGMPSFGGSPDVSAHVHQLYAYLKGRSDGAITRAKVEPLP